jgi:hypothetical protein
VPPGSSGPEPAYPGGVSATPAQPEPTDPDSADSADSTVEPAGQTAAGTQAPRTVPAEPVGQNTPAPEAGPAATSDSPVSIPADGPLSDAQLAAIAASAQPATVRRAPRYKAFFWTGALVGIVLGVFFGLGLSYDGMVNRWIYVVVTVLGTALVTVLLAGALAALVDKRGASKAAKQRDAATRG